ncbi:MULTISPECIES: DUF3237 domain-containing protein [Pseudomonas]|uniref:UPF0311 protein G5B91_08230 n=1 Tax=Pseudomonas nitroreducens TaxID=46680 RepID=A0A6G6ITD3_PSENT|nr:MULTISPECIES: DUF3237 domain-containing protein [Pseudomonas]MBG6291264.1 DUF3237 domain-containing protein [Pseudomonas nitroreducens]MCJ1879930.1 DUF3237 domain-containing protein [Pseudomonas nitroreducens]MCJ1894127.1 DUF3237 domain-containing protein [Pseudomonas nitroreducens]NMZ61551.1 DUF3237 domain-containing protein [Pseudomonas nitroreducens]NNN25591.1 DUF3237 domain-containing protein [Pseudomonas nitroreducens]
MKLEPLMEMNVKASVPLEIGRVPQGQRLISAAGGGTFKGQRLSGEVLPGGGDWILVDGDGGWHLEVRLVLRTDDGARILMQHNGLLVANPKIIHAVSRGDSTEFGDTYFMIQPRFEVGDDRYRWLNHQLAVGEGRLGPGWVEYRLYSLANG